MVAKVISGKNIRGVLNYNENKVQEGIATCIMASGFGCELRHLTFSDKINRFTKATSLNSKVKTNAIHISLNFDVKDKLPNDRLTAIASMYMEQIGFGGQPFLVYRHTDAAHPHIHIVTTNVKSDGKRIDIHNIGRNQSEIARKEIEVLFELVRAETRRQKKELLGAVEIRKAQYGESETKRSISNIVRYVTRQFKYTSLPELNAALKQFNVMADTGSEGSAMYKRNGLLYSIIDAKGERIGVPIKASAIYGKPTKVFLDQQYRLNETMRSPFKANIKSNIDRVLKEATTSKEFVRLMKNSNVFVLFRENKEGRIYGVTFVDNVSKCVFNGSDLGKTYSANVIFERMKVDNKSSGPSQISPKYETANSIDFELTIGKSLDELLTASSTDCTSPDTAMRVRKRRRRKKGRSI